MSTLYKLHVHGERGLVITPAISFTETEKMLRDILWDDSNDYRYCDRQIRKEELLKFKEGLSQIPASGVVRCFEEDIEQAKQVLIDVVNKRTVAECARMKRMVDIYNREVECVPDMLLINMIVETETNDHRS